MKNHEIQSKGWLIVNEFLTTTKFTEHTKWLLKAATSYHIQLEVLSNAQAICCLQNHSDGTLIPPYKELPDFVLSWDKDVRLAYGLEQLGVPVYNSAHSIANCDDKAMTHVLLQTHGIRMPKTIIAPMTYPNIGYTNYDFLSQVVQQLSFPIVVKECYGSFGAQVYMAANEEELLLLVKNIGAKPMLFQEFIQSSSGRDVRLQVVGNRVVAAMYRFSQHGDFRANITNGGSMKPYHPSHKEQQMAIACCKALGLTFAGVDLLFGDGEERYVCEVNSNAHFKNIYECTGVDTAACIMEELLHQLRRNGKDR